MNSKEKGAAAEGLAARYLQNRGYQIIERNWVTKFGELDIVARDGDTTVFVEVKAGYNPFHGLPRENVNKAKQKKLILLATQYIKQNRLSNAPARFDVVEVLEGDITHIKNAFECN